ncbi:MAG TPA: hypothetical protein VEU47_04600 [Candidatus Cybelea sp.]|nr:hypothetical protein [Candidatus Cybelea sp.]
MSRSLTVSAMIVLSAAAFGLYRLSYTVQRLEDELADYNRAILDDREAIQVLNAEWSYLTRPEALEELTRRNLDMHPLLPDQITSLSALPDRPPVAEAPPDAPQEPPAPAIPLPKFKHPPAASGMTGVVPVAANERGLR